MTRGSTHDADATQTTGNSDSRRASRRRTTARNSDAVPEGGNIDRTIPSSPQIVMGVAVLVLVTVVSFGAVSVVSELCPRTARLTG